MGDTFLSNENFHSIGDVMNKTLPLVFLILIAALSGCLDSDSEIDAESQNGLVPVDVKIFERPNTNLDAKVVDVKLFPRDVRAGEKVTAELIIANTGTENIVDETVEIEAKLKSLEDTMANIGSKIMSEEEKTRSFSMDFKTEIKPGTNGRISAVFPTVQEIKGYSLAGTYEITITLSVNGQKVESNVLLLKLRSGTPREFTPAPTPPPTPTPTQTPTPTPTPTITRIATPTPAPTPEPSVVATPTGKSVYARVKGSKFTVSKLEINAGDEVMWDNHDDTVYTIVDMNKKMANITIRALGKARHLFNTTGNYRLGLYYTFMRTAPSIQNISVRVNASR